MTKHFYVYIVTNLKKTVFYTGMTNDLQQRIVEHYLNKSSNDTFTGKYKTYYLLHYEIFPTAFAAINREKEIKGWRREKKINLIKTENDNLDFLNNKIFDEWPPKEMFHRKDF
jgi:putative endonuclease